MVEIIVVTVMLGVAEGACLVGKGVIVERVRLAGGVAISDTLSSCGVGTEDMTVHPITTRKMCMSNNVVRGKIL
jgi:hypothetical protein